MGSADDHEGDHKRPITSPGWAGPGASRSRAGSEPTSPSGNGDLPQRPTASRVCPECDAECEDLICDECGTRTFTVKRAEDPMIGELLEGRYRIESVIGRGGMSVVYRATQVVIHKAFAVKMIKADFDNRIEATKRFYREARAASLLSHPHTIRVFDFGQSDRGDLYLVMEYVAGQSLSQLLEAEAPLPARRALKIVNAAAQSLTEAHAAGLAHRDLKPDNLMLADVIGDPDFVKILDFGIAKWLSDDAGATSATASGVFIGTPYYASPEQARGSAEISSATDIYSLGVVLYEMLTDQRPFDGTSAIQILVAHASRERKAELPEDCIVPPGVRALVHRMLAKDATVRPSASEVAATCEQLLAAETGPVRTDDGAAATIAGGDPGGYEDTAGLSLPLPGPPRSFGKTAVLLALAVLAATAIGFSVFWLFVRTAPDRSPDEPGIPQGGGTVAGADERDAGHAADAADGVCAANADMSENMYQARGVDAEGDHCPRPAHHKDQRHGVIECHYGSVLFLRTESGYDTCVDRAEAVVRRLHSALHRMRDTSGRLVVGKDGHHAAIFARFPDDRDRARIVTVTSTDLAAYRTRSRKAGCDRPLSGHDLAHWWAALLIDHRRTMSLGQPPTETAGTRAGAALAKMYRAARAICPGAGVIPMPVFGRALKQLSPRERDDLIGASYTVPCGWEPR